MTRIPFSFSNKSIPRTNYKIHPNKMELLQSQAPAERELLGNQLSGHYTLEFRFGTLDIRVWALDIRVGTLEIRVGTLSFLLTCANHGDHGTSMSDEIDQETNVDQNIWFFLRFFLPAHFDQGLFQDVNLNSKQHKKANLFC